MSPKRCECLKPAIQRVLAPGKVVFRCEDHLVTDSEAAEKGWQLFDMVAEGSANPPFRKPTPQKRTPRRSNRREN